MTRARNRNDAGAMSASPFRLWRDPAPELLSAAFRAGLDDLRFAIAPALPAAHEVAEILRRTGGSSPDMAAVEPSRKGRIPWPWT